MRVFIYNGGLRLVGKSGVGQAIFHQREMLRRARIETSHHWLQRAGAVHINTVLPDSVLVALAAKLLTEAVPLNRSITRGELAELAAKALKLRLPTRLEETPFQDVPPASSAAGAITALYEAGIVEGSALPGGQSLYRPDEPLRRSEIAAIIWRIQQAAKKA